MNDYNNTNLSDARNCGTKLNQKEVYPKTKKKTWGTARNLVDYINRKITAARDLSAVEEELEKSFCRGIVYALKAEGYKVEFSEEEDRYVLEDRESFQNRVRNNSTGYGRKPYYHNNGNQYKKPYHYNNGRNYGNGSGNRNEAYKPYRKSENEY